LTGEFPDIIYRIIGSGIQLKDVKGKILVFVCSAILVDLLCQNTGASGFSYPSGTREQ
jgi:hypothetical protein